MAEDPRKERRAGARDANAPHEKRQSTAAATAAQPCPRPVPLGCLGVTERWRFSDRRPRHERATARAEGVAPFTELTLPLLAVALATGGTARALRRHGPRRLGQEAFESVI